MVTYNAMTACDATKFIRKSYGDVKIITNACDVKIFFRYNFNFDMRKYF